MDRRSLDILEQDLNTLSSLPPSPANLKRLDLIGQRIAQLRAASDSPPPLASDSSDDSEAYHYHPLIEEEGGLYVEQEEEEIPDDLQAMLRNLLQEASDLESVLAEVARLREDNRCALVALDKLREARNQQQQRPADLLLEELTDMLDMLGDGKDPILSTRVLGGMAARLVQMHRRVCGNAMDPELASAVALVLAKKNGIPLSVAKDELLVEMAELLNV